jgi:hypothetical protein
LNFYRLALPLLFLAASDLRAFSVFPALGYGSSSGFVFGAGAVEPVMGSDSLQVGILTLGAYYGTSGMVRFSAGEIRAADPGGLLFSAEYERLTNRDWFGRGNFTSPDSSASMDYEKQSLSMIYRVAVAPVLSLDAGLSLRHSSVYDREESPLWAESSLGDYGSTWSAGPDLGVRLAGGADDGFRWTAEMSGLLQAGGAGYGRAGGKFSFSLPVPAGMEVAASAGIVRHFGSERTPLPFFPCLGQAQGFRAYSDFRFTGPVWALCTLEFRKMLRQVEVPGIDEPWRLGVAVFADAGQVAEEFGGLRVDRFHLGAGTGLRLTTAERFTLKLDGAWGDEGLLMSAGMDHPF